MHLTFAPPYEHSGGNTVDVTNNSNANSPDALLKRCPKCGERKPCAEFYKHKNRPGGLAAQCKQCAAKYDRDNASKIHERQTRYYRDNIDELRERQARYRSENPDKLRERSARYRSENPGQVRESKARWQQANPDKVRAAKHRRRATKRALPSQWTDADAQRMLAYWKNCCAVCGQKVEPNHAFYFLAADHWIALTSPECPGTVPWNMIPLCHSKIGNAVGCNNLKSNADPIAWLHDRYPGEPKQVAKILARIAKYFEFIETDGAQ